MRDLSSQDQQGDSRWSENAQIRTNKHLYIVSVFYTDKIQGDQDHAFLFKGGLTNYKVHYILFWFRLLLRGNSPTFSGLILKMNSGYNGVSKELKKFVKWKGEMISYPCLKGNGYFIDREAVG
jgi:hypothetical protein